MTALRRCDQCQSLQPLCSGQLINAGGVSRFVCRTCREAPMESRFDRDSYWLSQRLGRDPSEDEEELFCEWVMRLWSEGLDDDQARSEAFRRSFKGEGNGRFHHQADHQ